MLRSAIARNQAAAFSQCQDHFASARFFECCKCAARIARAGEQRGFVRAEKKDIHAGNDLQNFPRDLLSRGHSDVERNPAAASVNLARDLFRGTRGAGVEKIVADEMRGGGSLAKRPYVAQIFHEAVCGAAPEKGALAVGRDVDVEKAGHRVAGALDPARVHAAPGEMLENVIAEAVAAHVTGEAHVDAPARESQCRVCAYAAAMHFELGREAVLARLRPSLHAAEHVDVDVADRDDGRLSASLAALSHLLIFDQTSVCCARSVGRLPEALRRGSRKTPVYRRLEICMLHILKVLRGVLIAPP